MEIIANLVHTLLSFFVILSIIVFVHEFGHFIVARWCGVKIDAFSIGFGKELWGFTDKHGTRWKLSALPLGGYVKMFGDASEASTADEKKLETLSEEEKAVTFHHKPLWKKSLVVIAGPAANFLLCIAIYTTFLMMYGMQSTEPVVGDFIENSAAQAQGMQKGDVVLTIEGEEVEKFGDIPIKIAHNLGTPMEFTIRRGKEILTLHITPAMKEVQDALGNTEKVPMLGITNERKVIEIGFWRSIREAARHTYAICKTTLRAIGQIITGDRSLEGLKGPVGIAKMSGQAADQDMNTFLMFIAVLSANLGLMNLLPIPLLDGGHLAFYAAEALRGRPLARKVQEYGFRLGFAMLITLMAVTLFNDIRNLIS